MILAFAIAGCDDKNKVDKEVSGDVSKNETVTENKVTEETQTTDNKKDDTTTNTETNKNNTTTNKNESTSNKNETTTKPSTGTNNTGSTTKPSNGNNNTTTKPSTGSTNNSGSTGNTQNNNGGTTTQPSTPVHEHKWTEVVEEEIHYYAWRTLCGKCGLDMTDMSADDLGYHTAVVCHSRYSTKYIEVDFATENVVKTPVVTGYKCECGAEK